MRSQHGLPGVKSKLQTTAARNDPRLDYAERIGIKGFPTTPITDKPRKLNKSSDPGARYWGSQANGQRQGGCHQGWSVGFGPTQNGSTRVDLRNARTVCFNFQNPPWTMLTVAVCDLFFVLHFAAFRAWPSQPLGPHSYGTVHRPATTARFGTYGCLLPTIRNPPPTQATVRDKCYGCRLIGSQESVLAFLLRPLARRRQTSSVVYAMQYEPSMNNKAIRPCGSQVLQ